MSIPPAAKLGSLKFASTVSSAITLTRSLTLSPKQSVVLFGVKLRVGFWITWVSSVWLKVFSQLKLSTILSSFSDKSPLGVMLKILAPVTLNSLVKLPSDPLKKSVIGRSPFTSTTYETVWPAHMVSSNNLNSLRINGEPTVIVMSSSPIDTEPLQLGTLASFTDTKV